jgi:UDP-GlcNAc:undecaprenyl-phosphate GlcNAc-1-phosphate transferase
MNTLHVISPLAAFLVTYLLIPALRKVAIRINLVDKPHQRKVHSESVPLVGGISIFLATALILGLSLPFQLDILSQLNLFVATFILLLMGVIDDRFDLSASLKLVIQLILAHYVVIQGIKIESLYGVFGIYELVPWAQYLLTVVVITGVVNAINLMDGIDGLAAGMAVLSFVVLAVLAVFTKQYALALVFMSIIGSLLAFLEFNFSSKQKTFMGDAGSLMLGFVIVVSGIYLIQSASGTSKITLVTLSVIVIMMVPVLDALRVFRRRVKSSKSPFSADKTHLHHLILSTGMRHKWATMAIITLIIMIIGVTLAMYSIVGITISLVLVLVVFYLITKVLKFNNTLNNWKGSIRVMEKASETESRDHLKKYVN